MEQFAAIYVPIVQKEFNAAFSARKWRTEWLHIATWSR